VTAQQGAASVDYQVEWDQQGYEVWTGPLDKGGEVFVANSPCDMAEALQGKKGVVENQRGLIDQVAGDCEVWRQANPLPAPTPVAPNQDASNPPAVEAGPSVQDSPASQGAPDVKVNAAVEARPSDGRANSRVPTHAAFDQFSPIAPDVLATWLAPPGASDADISALEDRIRKNKPMIGEPDPSAAASRSRTATTDGDPVDLFTGALSMSVVDLVVPTAVIPIRFERSYRSGRPYFGPFGFGWDHCYNVYLRRLNDGGMAFWSGQLRELRFRAAGAGWEPERGLAARLEQVAGLPDAFEVVFAGGLKWRFERPAGWGDVERNPLSAITDRHGNTVRISYDGRDRVASVLDDAGRGLLFHYGDCGLLEQLTDHTETSKVHYEHHGEIEQLVQVVLPATAEFPKGVATSYEYDRNADHPAMRHNILRVIDAAGNTYLENEYAGPEVGWAFNSVKRQLVGGFEYQFEYEQIQYMPADEAYLDLVATRTSAGPPDGSLHVYTFNYRGDLLDHRFRLNADHSYRVITSQRSFDAEGNTTEEVGPDGLRHAFTYDVANADPCARRNPLRTELRTALPDLAQSRILVRLEYEPRYQLPVSMTDEANRETRMIYDLDLGVPSATGRLQRVELPSVTIPDGTTQQSKVRYEFNARGQVTATVSPEGVRSEQHYVVGGPHDGFLARIVEDPSGNALATTIEYDVRGFPLRVTAPGGRATDLTHNALGQIEQLSPPLVDGAADPVRQWFGDDGSVVRVERPRGSYGDAVITEPYLVDVFERDVLGRVRAAHLAANTARSRVWRQQVDHDGRPVVMTDPTGARTERRYDERGLLLRETRAVGTPEQEHTDYTYDRAGRIRGWRGPLGGVHFCEYDIWGRLGKTISANGATTTFTWAARDLLMEVRVVGSPGLGLPERLLRRESFEYDERGRLQANTDWSFIDDPTTAVPVTTRYLHDMDDRMRAVQLPRGATSGYEYDGLGRLRRTTDPDGNTVDAHYDAAGDRDVVTLRELASGVVHEAIWGYTYDARGRVLAVDAPASHVEFDYDGRDVVVERREPAAVVVRSVTGPSGELDERIVDPAGLAIRSRWEYDGAGRVIRYVDPTGAATTWQYDALGQTRHLTLPDGSTWTTNFDLATHRAEQTKPSGTRVTLEFDAVSEQATRLTCAAAPGVEAVPDHHYGYDALGRLVTGGLPDGAVGRRYDSFGRVVHETARGKSVNLHYDDTTGDIDLVYPDGRRERTTHDASGRPTSVRLSTPGKLGGTTGDLLAEIQYIGVGRPSRIAHGNGVITTLAYDHARRLVGIEHARGRLVLDAFRTRYDERGRRAVVQLSGGPSRATVHHFDAADRLSEARSGFPLPDLADVRTAADERAQIVATAAAAAAAPLRETYVLDDADDRTQRHG
jgi:YD repeat-containing protein